jgi:hypothetical protein
MDHPPKKTPTFLIMTVLTSVLIITVLVALAIFVRNLRARKRWYALAERNSKFNDVLRGSRGAGDSSRVKRHQMWELLPGVERRVGIDEGQLSESESEDLGTEMNPVAIAGESYRRSPEDGDIFWSEYEWDELNAVGDARRTSLARASDDLIRLDSEVPSATSTANGLVARKPRPPESLVSISPPSSLYLVGERQYLAPTSRSNTVDSIVTMSATSPPEHPSVEKSVSGSLGLWENEGQKDEGTVPQDATAMSPFTSPSRPFPRET